MIQISLFSLIFGDTVSAFSGRGKVKPRNLMVKNAEYVEAFAKIGICTNVSSDLQETIERFVRHMYGGKGSEVNEMRYQLYCKSGGKIGCENLPHCRTFDDNGCLDIEWMTCQPAPEEVCKDMLCATMMYFDFLNLSTYNIYVFQKLIKND